MLCHSNILDEIIPYVLCQINASQWEDAREARAPLLRDHGKNLESWNLDWSAKVHGSTAQGQCTGNLGRPGKVHR